MDGLLAAALAQPLWLWLALTGVLLAVELATGTGWLLWPAASAGVTALLLLVLPLPPLGAAALFAVLTIVSTLLGRRFFRKPAVSADINDQSVRMTGQDGVAVADFEAGQGRALVAGQEWAAELDGGGKLAKGARLVVVGMLGGARLKVKPS